MKLISAGEAKMWSRIGAVYALGFLGLKVSVPCLILILEDSREPLTLRCHAAEAFGDVQHPKAVAALERVLMQKEPAPLKKWCIYALAQIGTSRAKMILVTGSLSGDRLRSNPQ